jgi:hypothetical protein
MSRKRAGATSSSKHEVRLNFCTFTCARQEVLLARRAGKPQSAWTADPVLATARFCNIDRRDDAVTAELLAALKERPQWTLRQRILLAAGLRFTGSRRGETSAIAALIDDDADEASALCQALEAENIKCGAGTYQLSLNRKQVAARIQAMSGMVVERVRKSGPFADVLEASDFVADCMTHGKRPQFSANETAKDFAYIPGLMQPSAPLRCRLGPGARKGLALVRAADATLRKARDEAAIELLVERLRASSPALLSWACHVT